MWKPATRQITGTNDGVLPKNVLFLYHLSKICCHLVPLGQRRRFGPAPADDGPAPQLAQPSPSAYPRSRDHDDSLGKNGHGDSPSNGDLKGEQKDIVGFLSLRYIPLYRI